MENMTAAEKAKHRIRFHELIQCIKDGSNLNCHPDYPASIIWARQRIDELESSNEKQGGDMAEASDDKMREVFLKLTAIDQKCREALAWGHSRILDLEKLVKELELKIQHLETTRKQGE